MKSITQITKAEIIELLEIANFPGCWFDVATLPKRKRWERLLKAITAGRESGVSQSTDKRQIVS